METRKRKVWLLVAVLAIASLILCYVLLCRITVSQLTITDSTHENIVYLDAPAMFFSGKLVKALYDVDAQQFQLILEGGGYARPGKYMLFNVVDNEYITYSMAYRTLWGKRYLCYLYSIEGIEHDLYLFDNDESVIRKDGDRFYAVRFNTDRHCYCELVELTS